ncbi:hypothetical protein HMPREF9413_4287 [Paenibacillus sp. HGF7]|nr:hypothetical protein HMPREF9413_4287 [Paenibacillus sp. HGF7]
MPEAVRFIKSSRPGNRRELFARAGMLTIKRPSNNLQILQTGKRGIGRRTAE